MRSSNLSAKISLKFGGRRREGPPKIQTDLGGLIIMLDFFLVLGQIPGTNVRLTFSDIMLIGLALLSWAVFRFITDPKADRPRPTIWDSLVRYEQPQLKPAPSPIHRMPQALPANDWLGLSDRRWRIVR